MSYWGYFRFPEVYIGAIISLFNGAPSLTHIDILPRLFPAWSAHGWNVSLKSSIVKDFIRFLQIFRRSTLACISLAAKKDRSTKARMIYVTGQDLRRRDCAGFVMPIGTRAWCNKRNWFSEHPISSQCSLYKYAWGRKGVARLIRISDNYRSKYYFIWLFLTEAPHYSGFLAIYWLAYSNEVDFALTGDDKTRSNVHVKKNSRDLQNSGVDPSIFRTGRDGPLR